ncbi:MAG: hypothetical protein ACRD6X_04255 [Pyrinomonadaceae bacterium]
MGQRTMNELERGVAWSVFGYTIPYDRIHLSTGLGAGGRPFTIPDPLRWGHYMIYIGSKVTWGLLIHELSHVWQGHNSELAWGYTLDSLFAQMVHGKDAYKYKLGSDWREYNVEQQASIVEDWYLRGRRKSDPAFGYIRDNLWHPEKQKLTFEDYDNALFL